MAGQLSVVVSEDRAPRAQSGAILRFLVSHLARRTALDVIVLPHLYDLAPDGPGVARLRAAEGDLVVLAWLYPRATYWLLAAHHVHGHFGRTSLVPVEEMPDEPEPAAHDADEPGPSRAAAPGERRRTGAAEPSREARRTIWCIDLRGIEHPAALLAEIDRIALETTGQKPPGDAPQAPLADASPENPAHAARADLVAPAPSEAGDRAERVVEPTRRRWYPVVDYGRCGGCLECLNFCLFGVFGLDQAGKLLVEQADACRDGCPACARVCPSGAIMFPMHPHPAIAGDPALPLAAFQQDLVQFLGGAAERSGVPGPVRTVAAAERERFAARSPIAPGGQPSAAPAAGTSTAAAPATSTSTAAAPATEPAAPSDVPGDAKQTPRQPAVPSASLDELVDRLDQSDL